MPGSQRDIEQLMSPFRLSSRNHRNHKKNGNESGGKGNLPQVGAKTISLALCLQCSTIELTWGPSSHKLSWVFARVYKISSGRCYPVPLMTWMWNISTASITQYVNLGIGNWPKLYVILMASRHNRVSKRLK